MLKALRTGAINIVAIHNHMTWFPRMVFLHYWGSGRLRARASLRTALDTQHLIEGRMKRLLLRWRWLRPR